VKEPGIPAVHCPQEWKPHLIDTRPEVHFETDHYKGWPAIQMRLDTASDADIDEALRRAWMAQAPSRLRREHGAGAVPPGTPIRRGAPGAS
jgi:hypothetical protein